MFKKGDKVKIKGGYFKGDTGEVIDVRNVFGELEEVDMCSVKIDEFTNRLFFVENLELVSTEDTPSKESKAKTLLNSLYGNDIFKPNHYQTKNGDLFDEWYERYYNDTKTYTGKEVFIEIMKAVAERYIRRYPNKNAEDIEKGVYTLVRLKEYINKEVKK